MAQIRFANNVSTQLTKPVAADDSTIEVRSLTHGLVWPNISATGDYFLVVIDDISTASWEIMKCTKVQVNGNETVLTVDRGLEGTTATTFQAGSVVENRLTAGTLDTFGAGFPAKVEINRGGTGATTAADARTNLDVPSKADLSSEVNTRTSEINRLDQKITDNIPPAATTSVRGTVILSSATDSVSEALAATPKAVKTAYDKAVAVDTRLTSEVTTLEAADTATNQKLTSEVSRLEGEIAAHTPPDASLTTKGIVQLSSAINSTIETLAATPKAVKTAYDKAVAAAAKSASADKLTTARSITLTGPVTGTVNFDGSANVSIPTTVVSATTSQKGIVQLSSSVTSTSNTTAATSTAVKTAYDKAVTAHTAIAQALPVGSMIASFASDRSGYLLCNGAAVSRTTYENLYSLIGTKFGVGDGTTTFNLPDFRSRTFWGANGNLMKNIAAGLPNIEGNLQGAGIDENYDSHSMFNVVTGAFYKGVADSSTETLYKGGLGSAKAWYHKFNASRSNSTYGNSTTVQPPAIGVNIFIKY